MSAVLLFYSHLSDRPDGCGYRASDWFFTNLLSNEREPGWEASGYNLSTIVFNAVSKVRLPERGYGTNVAVVVPRVLVDWNADGPCPVRRKPSHITVKN